MADLDKNIGITVDANTGKAVAEFGKLANAEKEVERAAERAAKEAQRLADKAAKEAARAADKLGKDAARAANQMAQEMGRALQQQEKAAAAAAAAAERTAKARAAAVSKAAEEWHKMHSAEALAAQKSRILELQIGNTNMRIRQSTRVLEEKRRKLNELEGSQRSFADTILAAKGKIALYGAAIGGAVLTVDKMITRSFQLQNVYANLPFSIDAARDASHGLADSMQLSTLAVQANRLKVADSEETFARVVDAATKLGASVGRDVPDAIERMIMGLGKGEQELLDELGLTLKVNDALEQYAERTGIATSKLSDAERAQVVINERLREAEEKASGVKFKVDEATLAWISFKAELQDLADIVLPYLTKALAGIPIALRAAQDAGADFLGIFGQSAELAGLNQKAGGLTKTRGLGHIKEGEAGWEARMQFMLSDRAAGGKRYLTDEEKAAWASLEQAEQGRLAAERARVGAMNAQAEAAMAIAQQYGKSEFDKKLKGQLGIPVGRQGDVQTREEIDFGQMLNLARMAELGEHMKMQGQQMAFEEQRIAAENARRMDMFGKEMGGQRADVLGQKAEDLEREIELMQAKGEHEDRLNQAIEQRIDLLIQEAEIRGDNDKVEQLRHQKQLKQVQAEQMVLKKRRAFWGNFTEQVSEMHIQMGTSIARAALMQGQSWKEAVHGVAKATALEMTIQAAAEGIRALIAAASFNYPKATQHGINAGLAAGMAATAGALAAATRGRDSYDSASGSSSMPSHSSSSPSTSSSPRSSSSRPNGPLSPEERGQSAAGAQASSPAAANGNTYVLNFGQGAVQTIDPQDKKTGQAILQAIRTADSTLGGKL